MVVAQRIRHIGGLRGPERMPGNQAASLSQNSKRESPSILHKLA
jgi:hypothetical protein